MLKANMDHVVLLVLNVAMAAALCTTHAGVTTCTPSTIEDIHGTHSHDGEEAAPLATRDLKKKQSTWSKYVEFYGTYQGDFVFEVPANANPKSQLKVQVNFRGPSKKMQKWAFGLVSSDRSKIDSMFSNSAKSWKWQLRKKTSKKQLSYYLDGNQQVRLRIWANNDEDDANVDYAAVTIDTIPETTAALTTAASSSSSSLSNDIPIIPPQITWQWQLSGTVDTTFDVDLYDIDLFDVPASTIADLKASGKTVICYFSAGSYESWRPDASDFQESFMIQKMDGWDEQWLDIRKVNELMPIMIKRMQLAVAKGCDGVEPDNVDAFQNIESVKLTYDEQMTYNKAIAAAAHELGLAVALKNDADQADELEPFFDFAVVEQCYQYNECDNYLPFVANGKAVLITEYKSQSKTEEHCDDANSNAFSLIYKKLALKALPYFRCPSA